MPRTELISRANAAQRSRFGLKQRATHGGVREQGSQLASLPQRSAASFIASKSSFDI